MPLIPKEAHRIVLPGMKEIYTGKVRHSFELTSGEDAVKRLLVVTSKRISAFDNVLETPIDDKDKVLNAMSAFWFRYAETLRMEHHMISDNVDEMIEIHPELASHRDVLDGRSMLVKRGMVFPVEAVVRGNITGSGWKEYRHSGSICGIALPPGLEESEELEYPILTPTTKAQEGHDMPISFEKMSVLVGGTKIAEQIREKSLFLFTAAHDYARDQGIIIADTK